ncbi:hypothetical protein [Xanthomonas phage RTH11]|nr:hypothetical protein [Xanthomonas phage RTH11]
MNLNQLLEGPSRVRTSFGAATEVIRLVKNTAPEFRKVRVTVAPVTIRRKFLYPWLKDQVVEGWDVTATLQLKGGRKYTTSKILRLSLEHSMEMVSLEVARMATMEKLKQVQFAAAL